MRTICMYFQVHQPFRLKRYRFFDIGHDHYYYDDYSNEAILRRVADTSYLPANKILADIIKHNKGKFKVAFSISGPVLDQFELYAPDVLDSFKMLADTGHVEFICETDSHSLVSLVNRDEFVKQITAHRAKIYKYFGQNPVIFRNTELIYSDLIGSDIADIGFEGMITEGAKQILGWKSPNYLYCNVLNPRLKLLLRNFKLSDDIAFRFSNTHWNEFPLTTEKFTGWLNAIDRKEENINIFMDYDSFGGRQKAESGIFNFLKILPSAVMKMSDFTFSTPTEIVRNQQPVSVVSVPFPISWADEERDITAWLGNDLQKEAFNKLYALSDEVNHCNDPKILIDWKYLQSSDHFHYMSTKFFSDRPTYSYVNPFSSPYDAFINYMNVLNDFSLRLKKFLEDHRSPLHDVNDLLRLIDEKDNMIAQYQAQINKASPGENIGKNTSARAKSPGRKATKGSNPSIKKAIVQM